MTEAVQRGGKPRPAKPPHDPRPSIIFGMVVLLVTFGGLGSWSAVARIASAVIAPGVVMVDSNRKKVQHLEGGVVTELLVRDGDKVEAGEVLIRLDETRTQASLAIIQAKYDTTRAAEARLLAERDGASEVIFSSDLLQRASHPNVSEVLKGQKSLFQARRIALAGERSILKNRIIQLQNSLAGIRSQKTAKEQQIALIAEEVGNLQILLEKGYVARPRFLELKREEARLQGELGEHVSEIARAITKIGETELEMLQSQRDFREDVVDQLRLERTEIVDLEERLVAAKHILAHVAIRAPAKGIVVGMEVHTIGGVIRAGETILEIVPANDKLIVEAWVQPHDIDSVRLGQDANVRITAFKNRSTPTLLGQVTYVSADRIVDNRSGEAHYLARVAVTEKQVTELGSGRLQSGMPAEVMIQTGQRTAIRYLAQPLLDSMNRAWREE